MNKNVLFGLILIILGACLFLKGEVNWGHETLFTYFWASIFVIPVGVLFHWLYFSMANRRGVGLLIPGGIITTAGIVCQISMLFNSWYYMSPGFILAVAVGLFEFYWFGGRNKWLLIPINILTVLSLMFYAVFTVGSLFNIVFNSKPIIAITLILAGHC